MKRVVILCVWLFSVVAGHAQLSLDECRRLARENYPEIRQYDLVHQTEQYNLSNAARAWIPQLAFSAQATWQTDAPNFPKELTGMLAQQGLEIPGLRKDQYKVALELNQTIWDGGKSVADKRIARAEAAEQKTMTDVDLYELEGRVDDLYFGILLLDERIAQTNLTLNLLRSNLEKVRALQRNGVAMQSDADVLEAELLSVGQQLIQFESSCDSYRRMLGIFIGQKVGDRKLQHPSAVQPLSGESARPELAMFAAKIDRLTAQEKMVKSSSMPRLGFFAQGYYGYPGLDYMQRDVFLFNMNLQAAQENGDIARLRKAIADDDRIVALRRSVREAAESKLRNGIIDTHDLLSKITDESTASMARSMREIELLKAIYEYKHTINR